MLRLKITQFTMQSFGIMFTLGTSKISKPTPTGCMNVDVLIPEGLNSNQITITISIIVSVGS